MHYGCDPRCPKVREQLRKAREQAGEESVESHSSSDSNLSEVAGPSTVQRPQESAKRSKESSRHHPGTSSHTKSVQTPQRSHESAQSRHDQYPSGRGRPTKSPDASRRFDPDKRSQRRSKDSEKQREFPASRGSPAKSPDTSRRFDSEKRSQRRSNESEKRREYPSSRGGPIKSPDASRRFDPEKRSQRRSKESEEKRQYPSNRGSPTRSPGASRRLDPNERNHRPSQESGIKSPRSTHHGRREPDEYRSGSSSRTDSRDEIPQYVPTLKRAAAENARDDKRVMYEKSKRRERDFDDGAGPSGTSRGVRYIADEFGNNEDFNAHDHCDSHCRGLNERIRKFEDEEERKVFDEYLVHKGLPLFWDLCTCSYQCLVEQLRNDNFVTSTLTSIALFGVGLTLCSELNGWTIPNAFQ